MTDPPAASTPLSSRWRSPVWPLVALLFCLPLIGAQLLKVRVVNEVDKWLPSDDPGAEVLQWTRQHFERESRFLLSWDSSSLADPRVLALANRLKPAGAPEGKDAPAANPADPLERLAGVVTPHHVLSGMMSQGVKPETAIQRLQGTLVGSGLLKVRLTDAGRAQRATVEQQILDLARQDYGIEFTVMAPLPQQSESSLAAEEADKLPAPALPESDDADSNDGRTFHPSDWRVPAHDLQLRGTGFHSESPDAGRLMAALRGLTAGNTQLVEDAFFAPGAPVALTISVEEQRDDQLRETIAAVRAAAVEVGIPEEELRLGGSPIGQVELNRASFKALWNSDVPAWQIYKRSPLAVSALVGTVLAFLLLRSVRLALLVLFLSACGAAATVALVPATGQTLNSVLIVMPNLLMVIVMSSLIHLANYWRHAACAHDPDPVATAVKTSTEPTLMAGVTTSIGLVSLVTSSLLPVRHFGLYSAAGSLLALILVLWVFPALMRVFPGAPAPLPPPHENAWQHFGLWVARHRRGVALVALGLYGVAAYGLTYFHTETKVIRYFPPEARIVEDYQFLEDNLAGIVGVDIVLRFPPEPKKPREADEVAENDSEPAAEPAPEPAGNPAAKPLDLFQRMTVVRQVEQRLQSLPGVSGTMSLADFREEVTARPEKVTARYLRSLVVARKRIFETHAEETREFVTHAETPLSVVLDDVPTRIDVGEEVWRVRAQCSVLTSRSYAEFLREVDEQLTSELQATPGVVHFVTGMVPLFMRTQDALLDSLVNSFGLAFATVAVVMMIQIRSVAAGALVMLPNVLPIALVFGLISWYGIPLDVGTMITASIAMGISVDSELHFVSWFRDCLRQGMSRDAAVAHALIHCGPAMWQSCVVIALGLVMLAFADLLMISRFGWMMAAMILAAMLADLFFMPALLAGIMGRVLEKQVARQQAKSSSPAPSSAGPPVTVAAP